MEIHDLSAIPQSMMVATLQILRQAVIPAWNYMKFLESLEIGNRDA